MNDNERNVTEGWQHETGPTLCDNCGNGIPRDEHEMLRGCLQIRVYGGYGWFTDDIDIAPMGFLDSSYRPTFLFCHDCVVILWRMFPVFSRLFGMRGQHPFRGEDPCCEWGYQMVRNEKGEPLAVRYGDGSVVPYRAADYDVDQAERELRDESERMIRRLLAIAKEQERIAKLVDEDTSGG